MATQTAELRQLKSKLSAWDARRRLADSLTWLPRGLLAGLGLAVAAAVAARVWPILDRRTIAGLGAALALAGAALAVALVWAWRRDHLQMARRFDRLLGLRERTSTALELSQGILPVESRVISRRQLEQAAQTVAGVNAARRIPLRLDWRWWAGALIAAALVVLAVAIPNPQDRILAQQAEVKASLTQSLTRLEQLKAQAAKDPKLTTEEQKSAIASLDKAIETLKQPDVSQQEALAALNTAEKELRDLSKSSAAQQQKALEAASGLFSGTAAQQLADALANGDMQAAAEALKNIDPANLTPEQKQQLAQALASAADALKGSNPDLAQKLGEAADALKNGDDAAAQKALGQAGETLQQQARSGSNPNVQQYADQVGQSGEGVARAGKEPGSQPGQGGMGQAPLNGPGGSGQGQGDQQGQASNGGSGRGEGDGQPDGGGTTGNPMSTNNGPGDAGEKPWESIFSPQRVGGQGGDKVDIPGNPGAGVPTGNEGNFANNPSGQANVPYNTVWADYANSVNQALESGYIPLGMKDMIKTYFSNLDPSKK